MVRKTVVDKQFVVRCVRDIDVSHSLQTSGLVEGSGGDPNRRSLRRIPEQARAAGRAEAPLGVGCVVRNGEPPHRVSLVDADVVAACRRHGTGVTVPSPAVGAVTDEYVTQGPSDGVPDPAAQAASRGSGFGLPAHHELPARRRRAGIAEHASRRVNGPGGGHSLAIGARSPGSGQDAGTASSSSMVRARMIGERISHSSESEPPIAATTRVGAMPRNSPATPPTTAPRGRIP